MPSALLFLGLVLALVGLGVLMSSAFPRFRSRWKRRAGQGFGALLGGLTLFVAGALLSPSAPAPPITRTPAAAFSATEPAPQEPPTQAAPPAASTPVAGQALLAYVQGDHDGAAFRSEEVLEDGLRSYSWDAVPGVAGSLVLYAVPERRAEVFMAQLSDVTAPDGAFLGQAPQLVGESGLNRRFCVSEGPLSGVLVDITALADGSKQVQVFSAAYRQLRSLHAEIRCGT